MPMALFLRLPIPIGFTESLGFTSADQSFVNVDPIEKSRPPCLRTGTEHG